ncbi:MAG TPA: acyl-ACP thioesterase [Clostridiales bacterium]|nr:acyl-ACP thioesterase [Clostridiales bacterium]
MERVFLYKRKYRVQLSDVDFTRKLKLSTLFNYFQETASMASDNLDMGIDTLAQKYGVAWALIRVGLEINRNPSWNEEIIIETWPPEPNKFDFPRDFIVRDLDGNPIIKAISTWIIFDLKTRKIRKSEVIEPNYPEKTKKRALDWELGNLKHFGNLQPVYKKVIGYSDIDFNGHLNNSKYIDFMMDCFSVENHKKYSVRSMQINYINEALPGDTLVLLRDISNLHENYIYIEGINEKDNKPIFKAKVKIQPKNENPA